MKKRTVAVLFLALVAALCLAALALVRTPWAGERACRAAAGRLGSATGLSVGFDACRLDLLGLSVEIEGLRLSLPGGETVFTAELASARLAAVQALGRQVHLSRLLLRRPRLTLARADLPAGAAGGACPPQVLSRFEIRRLEVQDGALDVALGDTRLQLEGIEVRSVPGRRWLKALARPGRRTRLEASAGPALLLAGGRTLQAAHLQLAAEVAPDLSEADVSRAEVEQGGALVSVSGRIEHLCAPHLALQLSAQGPVAALAGLAGVSLQAQGTATLRAQVKGLPQAPAVSAQLSTRGVRVGRFTPGDLEAELRLAGKELLLDRVAALLPGGGVVVRGKLGLSPGLPLSAEAELSGVDLGEVLDRLSVTGPWITMHMDGKARVAGVLRPVQLTGQAEVAVRELKVLTRSFREGAGDAGVLAVERGRVETRLRIDRRGLYFDDGAIRVGRGLVHTDAAIHFSRAGGFWVRASGEADLDALGPIASVPWGGLASVSEVRVAAAPYAVPLVEGQVRAAGFRFLDLALGSVAATVRYQHPTLSITGITGTQGGVRYTGEAAVDLAARPSRLTSLALHATGPVHELCEAVQDRLPRARLLRERLDAEADLTAMAQGPVRAPDFEFHASLGPGTLLGRRFDGGRVAGQVRALEEARLSLAEVRRGAGVLRGSGTLGLEPPFPMDLEVSFAGLSLPELLAGAGLAGTVEGMASLSGTAAHPRVRGRANGAGLADGALELGTARLEGQLDGEQASFTASTEGVELSGEAVLGARVPFRVRGSLDLEDATTRLARGVAPPGLRLRAAGRLEAEGELLDWREARIDARLAELWGSYAELRVEATGPAHLTASGGRWELHPLELLGPNTAVTVSGAWLPSHELSGTASGAVDLRLLSGLVPTLRRAGGRLAVEARLSGTPQDPLVLGSGKLEEGTVQVKGAGISLTEVSGGLTFSQHKVILDRIDATVNGGRARFQGEVDLERLRPARLRAEAVLDEVPVAIPGLMPATLSGRLEAFGTPESSTLTGLLHVVRARYTSDVDLQGSLFRRRAAAAARAYDRAGEWLRLDLVLAVDGDVRVENDLVRGPVWGELTLTGTLASPGLLGSLAMGRGSRMSFRGNEFELTHAVLDFTDRTGVQVGLDVHGESTVRDYQVFLHAFGTPAEPQVRLTSLPELPEQDIVTLLSYRFTRRDAGAQGNVSGVATATAAQALLSASGLDEQVKRFLPRGGPIRDLSMRIVTGYSEDTGQSEPRAELESWLLRDRLRVRLQAPLGAGRGRQAQAEVKLGEHTAVQYQWDNESLALPAGDHGVDLKLRWDWSDPR